MEATVVARAVAAATALVARSRLPADQAIVLHNSNRLTLRLLPCDVVAQVRTVRDEVAALEIQLARALSDAAAPVAALDPRLEPRVHQRDGFAVTFWAYDGPTARAISAADYADALQRLHSAMRNVELATPHFLDRVAEAERLVTNREETPALAPPDRDLLLASLQAVRRRVADRGAAEQLLHGEPHPGNVLGTRRGPVFIDLETCCRGPVEFDVAHVPEEVSARCPGIDRELLQTCRQLVLVMVAAWRWDARDQFPDGHRHGRRILALLRKGAPWPALCDAG